MSEEEEERLILAIDKIAKVEAVHNKSPTPLEAFV